MQSLNGGEGDAIRVHHRNRPVIMAQSKCLAEVLCRWTDMTDIARLTNVTPHRNRHNDYLIQYSLWINGSEVAFPVPVTRAVPRTAACDHKAARAEVFVGCHDDATRGRNHELIRDVGDNVGVRTVAEHRSPIGKCLSTIPGCEAVVATCSIETAARDHASG